MRTLGRGQGPFFAMGAAWGLGGAKRGFARGDGAWGLAWRTDPQHGYSRGPKLPGTTANLPVQFIRWARATDTVPLAGINKFMPLVPLGDIRREGVAWPSPLLGATLRGGGAHTPAAAAPLGLPPGVQLMTCVGGAEQGWRVRDAWGADGQAAPFGRGIGQTGGGIGLGLWVRAGRACRVVSYDLGLTPGSAGVRNRCILRPRRRCRASAMQQQRGILGALGLRRRYTWCQKWGLDRGGHTADPCRQSGLAGTKLEGSRRAGEALSFRGRLILIRTVTAPRTIY